MQKYTNKKHLSLVWELGLKLYALKLNNTVPQVYANQVYTVEGKLHDIE